MSQRNCPVAACTEGTRLERVSECARFSPAVGSACGKPNFGPSQKQELELSRVGSFGSDEQPSTSGAVHHLVFDKGTGYCPDWEVAVYAIAGMGQIRFCKKPGCCVPFIPRFFSPDKGNEQKYCTPAHANADRAARSKAKKKAKEKRRK